MTKKGSSKYRMQDPVPGIGKPSVYHAVIVIFLEFFAWGLLTTPMIDLLRDTFEHHTLLINGLIQGIKGILSFLSAPLLGALSDVWGRKSFLLLTVFFTCAPIPLMQLSPWWFFAMTSLSGMFAVTFSIVFAYVADITEEVNRSTAYGLVSATFAASLVTSPAIGTYLSRAYGEAAVVALATAIAAFDVCFILVAVPESFPEKLRPKSWESQVSWEQVDPFGALKNIGQDKTLLLACTAVFLSYLPEAGQYSCIVLYLRHVIGFSDEKVASYIAVVGVLSIVTQTAILTLLFQTVGNRNTIIMGLSFQIGQLICYAFGKVEWMMWLAGCLAALSSINYPSLSSLVSTISSSEQQGVVQGMVTGIRGLCNGLGPAMFGLAFHIFHVQLDPGPSQSAEDQDLIVGNNSEIGLPLPTNPEIKNQICPGTAKLLTILPGPPFLFGAFTVIMAMLIAFFIPRNIQNPYRQVSTKDSDSQLNEGNALVSVSGCSSKHRTARTNKKNDYAKMSDSDDGITILNPDESIL
uniref:hippocampus abundant transcript 1 protein isoform X1 n=1 Tax=Ciona intestinalis TaxID=7719 RepID=UPI000EF50ABE|nr:hippocampus abundant transcript 1 protein isoform X1 [Ciona intestinalis]|eukprot:XP_026690310.1 hippocampus abundant transcript 1 protein isoform X1 [Ciona intestinalis]